MGSVVLHNVSKQFGGQVVLDNVTLELQSGETAALIGPNGIGKTTLFKLISGALPPDLGTVTRSKGLEIGYLPQEPDVPAGLTLRDAVAEAFTDLLQVEKQLQKLSHDIAEAHDSDGLDGVDGRVRQGQRPLRSGRRLLLRAAAGRGPRRAGLRRNGTTLPVAALSGGRNAGRRSPSCCCRTPSSCCSTSPPTTWTSTPSAGWRSSSPAITAAR
jgi:ATPase subunit of ABC transporter with duplicated ATPase domains